MCNFGPVGHTKVLFAAKKERNQPVFLLVRGILRSKVLRIELLASLHRSIGFGGFGEKRPKSIYETESIGRVELLGRSIGWLLRMDLHSTWQLLHHCAFDEVIARAVQSVTLRLLTLWPAGSTPRPTNQ